MLILLFSDAGRSSGVSMETCMSVGSLNAPTRAFAEPTASFDAKTICKV